MEYNKNEFNEAFRKRTKDFAIRVIRLIKFLPKNFESEIIGKQLLRSSTSVAANYRAVCRARSGKEFYSKLSIVVEEADETLFWIELLGESDLVHEERLVDMKLEITEILKVVSKARKNIHFKNIDPL